MSEDKRKMQNPFEWWPSKDKHTSLLHCSISYFKAQLNSTKMKYSLKIHTNKNIVNILNGWLSVTNTLAYYTLKSNNYCCYLNK
jgi:hypothetical protein